MCYFYKVFDIIFGRLVDISQLCGLGFARRVLAMRCATPSHCCTRCVSLLFGCRLLLQDSVACFLRLWCENKTSMSKITIYQFTDPTCIWCWGNEPMLRAIDYLYGDKVAVEFIMGGLVEDVTTLYDFDGPVSLIIERANARIAENWHAASARHGMPVTREYMNLYTERYTSSFPQNVAYEAAKRVDKTKAKLFLRRIREATFVENRRTSQIDVLMELATESGLDSVQFIDQYTYGGAQTDFMQDRMKCRRNGITGFPSYLIREGATNIILGGYQNLATMNTIISRLSDGKIKPRRVAPSIANVLDFIKQYKRVYPVEIEVAFSLDKARVDLMIEGMCREHRVEKEVAGNGVCIRLCKARRHGKSLDHATQGAAQRHNDKIELGG